MKIQDGSHCWRFNTYECHLQVVYYFINFQLAYTQFPSVVRLEKGIKIKRKMGEIGLPLWPPFFF